jgi:hypothetical protein
MQGVDEAMHRAAALRDGLEAACQTSRRALDELDSTIGSALARLATCPGVNKDLLDDPRTPLPPMPQRPGEPPRG